MPVLPTVWARRGTHLARRPRGDIVTIASDRPLPLIGSAPCSSGRDALTCRYRCGDACAHDAPNTSSTGTFADVMETVVSRRGLLRTGAVLGAVAVTGTGLAGSPVAAASSKAV